jgi:hypothetical protein
VIGFSLTVYVHWTITIAYSIHIITYVPVRIGIPPIIREVIPAKVKWDIVHCVLQFQTLEFENVVCNANTYAVVSRIIVDTKIEFRIRPRVGGSLLLCERLANVCECRRRQ